MAGQDRALVIKTEEFTGFLKQLRATLGDRTTMQRVVDSEVSKVLERAVELTGKADRSKIMDRVAKRSVFNVDGKKYLTRDWKTGKAWHVPNAVWSTIEKLRAQSLKQRIAAIGLSKQSFYLIAKKLGFDIAAPAFVKAAVNKQGRDTDSDARIQREQSENKYALMIQDTMPILKFSPPAGKQAFFSALAGRINFYKANVAHGVFDSVAKTAAKYKGVIVTQK